jgi:adenylate kinase
VRSASKGLRSGKIIGLTGTPGTGKKTLAPLLSAELRLPAISINELIRPSLQEIQVGELEVDPGEARERIAGELTQPCILYGHLLPYVVSKESVSKVIVLRCEPGILKRRLAERGYSSEKVVKNVEAELIGLVSTDARLSFGDTRTLEFDNSKTVPSIAAREIASMRPPSDGKRHLIDWTLGYGSALRLRRLLSP